MMFSSKTPRDLNHDPQPLVHPSGKRTPAFSYHFEFEPGEGGPYGRIAQAMFDPRPEFDHVQHNAPNRILLAHREYRDHVAASGLDPVREHLKEVGEMFGTDDVYSDVHGHIFTYEELEHAYRVLTRLAALSRMEQD